MIGDISIKTNLYVICGYTDMRRSIDGLCAIVQDMFHSQPDTMSGYLFCGVTGSKSLSKNQTACACCISVWTET